MSSLFIEHVNTTLQMLVEMNKNKRSKRRYLLSEIKHSTSIYWAATQVSIENAPNIYLPKLRRISNQFSLDERSKYNYVIILALRRKLGDDFLTEKEIDLLSRYEITRVNPYFSVDD